MKIGFHLENLTFRGTTVAVQDYAYYNQKLLGNESVFFYNKNLKLKDTDENSIKKDEIFQKIKNNYDLIEYSNIDDLEIKLKNNSCDYAYFLKAGFDDGVYTKETKSLVHCVFNNYQPHGHRYAYVSEWLANTASNGKCGYVPHIINLPHCQTENLRDKLNIPQDKIVIGRYGGYDQFDIPFVHETIKFILTFDPTFVFVFINTRKFVDHPNVFFLDPILDPQDKTNYILSCDAMLHARSDGESFGISICEFLFHDKPVLSCGLGRDKNNVALLQDYDMIYNSQCGLLQKMFMLKHRMFDAHFSWTIIEEFSPENVMKKFDEVFLRV